MLKVQTSDGKYFVVGDDDPDGDFAIEFKTHAEAWRFIDKQNLEPLNPQEKKSDWIAEQILGGTGRKA